jgi:hypothetical protein
MSIITTEPANEMQHQSRRIRKPLAFPRGLRTSIRGYSSAGGDIKGASMNQSFARRGMGAAGLGLLVVLLALLIILVMYFGNFGGKSYMQNVATARKQAIEIKAEIDTHNLTQLIAACYLSNNNTLPKTPEETGNEGAFRDPWGHQITFTYKKQGDKTYVVYHSDGPDGQPNTEDDVVRTDLLPL